MEQINLVFTTNQNNFKTCWTHLGGLMDVVLRMSDVVRFSPMRYYLTLRCGPMWYLDRPIDWSAFRLVNSPTTYF